MDIAGLKPLFGQRVVVASDDSKSFIGTLRQIEGSASAVAMEPVDATTANCYTFAINGVAALSVESIHFVQKLVPPSSSAT
jgi:hypothetical protein